jgi:Ser/Thr protein kinase RdoA (MazF antagonist)
MSGLGTVIAARVAAWGGAALPLEQLVFGSTDPDTIATAVDAWCGEHLGSAIAHYRFFDSSSGSVHGVSLEDGRDVVVKVHRPGLTFAYLSAISATQTALVDHGIPGPRPLVSPIPYGPAHVTAEQMIAAGSRADGHDPAVRRALAAGLATFVATGHLLGLEHNELLRHPMAMPADQLYPPPHSARFDFAATATGSEWIDALARAARTALATAGPTEAVLGHGDWRIDNVALQDDRIVAVYDWDSVCVEPEIVPVATSALTFCVDWERPAGQRFPSPAETRAFLDDYESARSRPFDACERAAIAARMVFNLAYGARCERADDHPEIADSQQGMLRALGPALLRRGLAALEG